MPNQKLTLKERETLKQFSLGITKLFQELQNCEDYQSVKDFMVLLDKSTDSKKWATNFTNLCSSMDI